MASYENYHEEILEDSLSTYERWQLEQYGHLLPVSDPVHEEEIVDRKPTAAEEAFIFNQENPSI